VLLVWLAEPSTGLLGGCDVLQLAINARPYCLDGPSSSDEQGHRRHRDERQKQGVLYEVLAFFAVPKVLN
jgi:hypothetical protein